MSYELVFWRQATDESRSPESIYQALCAGVSVEGLTELPIDEMVTALVEAFPHSETGENGPTGRFIEAPDNTWAMMADWSPHHLRVDCYGVSTDGMNKVIDIGIDFKVPLYDPQVNERF